MARDRHGRGLRAPMAPPSVPISRTRREEFDSAVLDAVEDLEGLWGVSLEDVDFAVDEAPLHPAADKPGEVADRGVRLGELKRAEELDPPTGRALVVVYRRPIEGRTSRGSERAHAVLHVVGELVAELLGRDPGELSHD